MISRRDYSEQCKPTDLIQLDQLYIADATAHKISFIITQVNINRCVVGVLGEDKASVLSVIITSELMTVAELLKHLDTMNIKADVIYRMTYDPSRVKLVKMLKDDYAEFDEDAAACVFDYNKVDYRECPPDEILSPNCIYVAEGNSHISYLVTKVKDKDLYIVCKQVWGENDCTHYAFKSKSHPTAKIVLKILKDSFAVFNTLFEYRGDNRDEAIEKMNDEFKQIKNVQLIGSYEG